jgi:hypothetical protein
MAIDNLNFYSNWLPAWQQTDKYSSQPWCLKSQNLDIFSSSKSVKATAWSDPTTTDADVIRQDWEFLLKTDWKVYIRTDNGDVRYTDPSVNFPAYNVSYTWEHGEYLLRSWGNAKDLTVKYENNVFKTFTVFTDRASYTLSTTKYTFNKTFTPEDGVVYQTNSPYSTSEWWYTRSWYAFRKASWSGSTLTINMAVENSPFANIPVKVYAYQWPNSHTSISTNNYVLVKPAKYYYDREMDAIVPSADRAASYQQYYLTWDLKTTWLSVELKTFPAYWTFTMYEFKFYFTKNEWAEDYNFDGTIYIDVNWWPWRPDWRMVTDQSTWARSEWDSNYYYSYLPIRDRKLTPIWEYYWMRGNNFQPLYEWSGSWLDIYWNKKTVYDFVQYMWWNNDPSMDIVWMTVWNEQVYMIWNLDWNWYIIPCDLSWGRWTPYIAYGCTFKWVTNIDYLMYLVWEDRGISQLWVYNWQEMVAILGWNEENTTENLIDNSEQYKFDWKLIEYRDDLILSTSDNRIFAYWQTYGGKGGAFIHQLPWTITDLKADWKDLTVEYSVTSGWATTKYLTSLQDDTPIKNYNTEWMAEYPIAIWNHLLEKEETDLYCSYILPSANTSLEFWGMANHYHFWTFTSSDSYTFSTEASYKMKGCTGNYVLKYIETNGNQYTFRLEWDLPVQTTNDMKITDTEWTELISYSDFNHFRKIGEITTTEYQEWEFRFHNLNNKLELPKSHSLQIMVKGKWTASYTPELFALDLVANQRDRW